MQLSFGKISTIFKSASESYKGSTKLGHALSKHAGRKPQIWGKISGAMSTWHNQGLIQLKEIIRAPGNFHSAGKFYAKWHNGRGVRLNQNFTFKGFLD